MPIEIHIRPATESDTVAIAALSKQLGYFMSTEETAKNIREILVSDDHAAFIAVVDNQIVGWIHALRIIHIESKPFIEIGGLVTDENHRKQGIGKLLVNRTKEWTKEKQIEKLKVRCNTKRTESHQFYNALGFSESKEQKVFVMVIE